MDDAAPPTLVHENFLKALARSIGREAELAGASEALETTLEAHVAPHKGDAGFVAFVGARIDEPTSLDDAVARFGKLALGDLAIAYGCSRGDRQAVAALATMITELTPHLRKVGSAEDADEVLQVIRTRMLVKSNESEPRILSYKGTGPLAGWLRVAAIRAARDLKRGRGIIADEEPKLDLPDASPMLDPELAIIKAKYGQHFRTALNEVISKLPDREKNILAMSVIDGLSTDAIGAIYQVNGSTVRRWLQQTRAQVLAEVRTKLTTTLEIHATELDSLMGVVRSQIDLNVSQLLIGRNYMRPEK